jgi:hypothetical protein
MPMLPGGGVSPANPLYIPPPGRGLGGGGPRDPNKKSPLGGRWQMIKCMRGFILG